MNKLINKIINQKAKIKTPADNSDEIRISPEIQRLRFLVQMNGDRRIC